MTVLPAALLEELPVPGVLFFLKAPPSDATMPAIAATSATPAIIIAGPVGMPKPVSTAPMASSIPVKAEPMATITLPAPARISGMQERKPPLRP